MFFAIVPSANAACHVAGEPDNFYAKECPADITKYIERESACGHFSGEFTGGSSPERDKEVDAELKKYDCSDEKLYCTRQALLNKYAHDSMLSDALAAGLHMLFGEDYTNKMKENESIKCPKS